MNKSENKFIETLARWWNTLNCWDWPEDMPGKPGWFANPLPDHDKYEEVIPIMHRIEAAIGKKECLRWHWMHHLERTNVEFEEWWGHYRSDL